LTGHSVNNATLTARF